MSDEKKIRLIAPTSHPLSSFLEGPVDSEAKAIREKPYHCNFCGTSISRGIERSFGTCLSCNRDAKGKSFIDASVERPKYRNDGSVISLSSRFDNLKQMKRNVQRRVKDILDPIPGPFDPNKEGLIDDLLETWMKIREITTLNFTDGLEDERNRLETINFVCITMFNNWEKLCKDGLEGQISLIRTLIRQIVF